MCPCDVCTIIRDQNGITLSKCSKCERVFVTKCEFSDAINIVRKELQRDEGLWITYQANIAMPIMDNSNLTHEESNKVADILMKHLFEAPRK